MSDPRARFRECVQADPVDLGLGCALIGAVAEPATDPDLALALLDALASEAAGMGGADHRPAAAAELLRVALGEQAGFAGFAEDYDDVRASLLPAVLARRRGLPILLAVVWVEVARRLGIPAYPIALPGHVIVGVGDPAGVAALVDPWAGGRVISPHEAADRVRSTGAAFLAAHLEPTQPLSILLRVLTNVRALAVRHSDPHTQRWAVELSLLLPGHPVALRRELGQVLVNCGELLGGARVLSDYADAVAASEPAAAESARWAARMARARLN